MIPTSNYSEKKYRISTWTEFVISVLNFQEHYDIVIIIPQSLFSASSDCQYKVKTYIPTFLL